MTSQLLLEAQEFNRSRRLHKRWQYTLVALASIVIFVTIYALILPALTMERELICGQEEHTHTEECYTTETTLVCTLEEGHVHTEECYGEEATLICGLEETDGHTHSDECYTEEEVLVCGLEETDGHTHGDDCYTEEEVLVCGLEETEGHTHTEDCYTAEEVLVCGQEECEGHTHSDACYDENGDLICGLEESEGHTHSAECYETEMVLTCGEEECEGHTHSAECYETQQILTCELEECEAHHHSDECYETQTVLSCGQEECEAHHHSDECYEVQEVLLCTEEEGHVHTDECYQTEEVLICEQEEHTHSEECYAVGSDDDADVESAADWEYVLSDLDYTGSWADDVLAIAKSQLGYTESTRNFIYSGSEKKGYTRYGAWYGIPYGDWCAMFVSFCLHYADVPTDVIPLNAACNPWVAELKSLGRFAYSGSYTPKAGDIIFFDTVSGGSATHVGLVYSVGDGEVTTIEGNTSNCVAYRSYSLDSRLIFGYGVLPGSAASTEESEYVCGLLEHSHDDSCYDENDELICGFEEHSHSEDCKYNTLTAEEESFDVTLRIPAVLPEGTELIIEAVDEEDDSEAYELLSGAVTTAEEESLEGLYSLRLEADDEAVILPEETEALLEIRFADTEADETEEDNEEAETVSVAYAIEAVEVPVDEIEEESEESDESEETEETEESEETEETEEKETVTVYQTAAAAEDEESEDTLCFRSENFVGFAVTSLPVPEEETEEESKETTDAEELLAEEQTLEAEAETETAEESTEEETREQIFRLEYTGEDYTVTLRYTKEANLPENAELAVREIEYGSDEYWTYYNQTVEAMMAENSAEDSGTLSINAARYFDVTIVADGEVYEPTAGVEVEITYAEDPGADGNRVQSIHFTDDEDIELPETRHSGSSVVFNQDSFSVIGVVVSDTTSAGTATNVTSLTDGGQYIIYTPDGKALTTGLKAANVTVSGDTVTLGSGVSESDVYWTYESSSNAFYYTNGSSKTYLRWTKSGIDYQLTTNSSKNKISWSYSNGSLSFNYYGTVHLYYKSSSSKFDLAKINSGTIYVAQKTAQTSYTVNYDIQAPDGMDPIMTESSSTVTGTSTYKLLGVTPSVGTVGDITYTFAGWAVGDSDETDTVYEVGSTQNLATLGGGSKTIELKGVWLMAFSEAFQASLNSDSDAADDTVTVDSVDESNSDDNSATSLLTMGAPTLMMATAGNSTDTATNKSDTVVAQSDTANVDITVKKTWADGTAGSSSVTVTLVCSDGSETSVTLDASNNWSYTFADQDATKSYYVQETTPSGYTASYTGTAQKGEAAGGGTWTEATSFTSGKTYVLWTGSAALYSNDGGTTLSYQTYDSLADAEADENAWWVAGTSNNGSLLQNKASSMYLKRSGGGNPRTYKLDSDGSSFQLQSRTSDSKILLRYQSNTAYLGQNVTDTRVEETSAASSAMGFTIYEKPEGTAATDGTITFTVTNTKTESGGGDTGGDTGDTDEGGFQHKKTIDYLGDGTANGDTDADTSTAAAEDLEDLYRLYLDITAIPNEPVDMLLVLDYSSSMKNNNLGDVTREAAMETFLNSFIPQFLKVDSDNRLAVVEFNNTATTIQGWLHQTPTLPDTAQGTNYQAALYESMKLLDQHAADETLKSRKVIMVFLSDGQPTEYMYVNSNKSTYATYATYGSATATTLNDYYSYSSVLSTATAKAVTEMTDYVTTNNSNSSLGDIQLTAIAYDTTSSSATTYLNQLSPANSNQAYTATDATTLKNSILASITPKAAVITDTLSENVCYYSDADLLVTVKDIDGNLTTLYENGATTTAGSSLIQSVSVPDSGTSGTVTVTFDPSIYLTLGSTYTVSFNVKTSDSAKTAYAASGTYPKTGDTGTDYGENTTSSGKDGFYSNSSATVTYTLSGQSQTDTYKKPVVQVSDSGGGDTGDTEDVGFQHKKTIDYLGDGTANGDTDADTSTAAAGDLNDLYRLYLDISATQEEPVDLLLVIDRSNSMDDQIDGTELDYTDTTGNARDEILVDYLNTYIPEFLAMNSENQVAVSWFANYADTLQSWSHSSPSLTIDNIGAYSRVSKDTSTKGKGGTNYQAGIYQAMKLLDAHAANEDIKDHKVIMVFLSDGKPTYYFSNISSYSGYTDGNSTASMGGTGNSTDTNTGSRTNSATTELLNYITTNNSTSGLGQIQLSSIAYATTVTDYLKNLSPATNNVPYVASSKDALKNSILSLTNPKAVVITDTLSSNVRYYSEDADLIVTVKDAKGNISTLYENGATTTAGSSLIQSVSYPDASSTSGGTVTVTFDPAVYLTLGSTYTVSFNVKTSDSAKDAYTASGTYPKTGDAGTDYGTNATSSGKDGFYSNSSATVTYTIRGKDRTDSYLKPVVQVSSKSRSFSILKQNSSQTALAGASFAVYREAKANETDTVSLTGLDGSYVYVNTIVTNAQGIATLNNAECVTYYLKEIAAPSGYEKLDSIFKLSVAADAETDDTVVTLMTNHSSVTQDGTTGYIVVTDEPATDTEDTTVSYHKTIDYLDDGDKNPDTDITEDNAYRLYLDITSEETEPIDLLIVLDRSNSMRETLAGGTASSTSEARDGIMIEFLNEYIEQFLDANDENHVAIAGFASYASTIQSWSHTQTELTVDNAGAMYRTTNSDTDGLGCTNYQAAIYETMYLLNSHAQNSSINGHKVVVLFLSDGEPTYHFQDISEYSGYTSGNSTATLTGGRSKISDADATATVSATNELLALINGGTVGTVEMKSIAYSTDATDEDALTYLNPLSPATGSVAIQATSASDLTTSVGQLFAPTTVTITDTLSDEVEFTDTVDAKVTKTAANGTETVLYTQSKLSGSGSNKDSDALDSVTFDTENKTVTAKFADSYSLESGCTYTLSFNVKVTEAAATAYAASRTYSDVGEAGTDYGTNETSSGKPGFYSNSTATVSYTMSGETPTLTYQKPVVQVKNLPKSITIIKQNSSGAFLADASFALYRAAEEDETDTVSITGLDGDYVQVATAVTNGNGIATLSNVACGYYCLVETSAPAGYEKLNSVIILSVEEDAEGAGVVTLLTPGDDVKQNDSGYIVVTDEATTGSTGDSKVSYHKTIDYLNDGAENPDTTLAEDDAYRLYLDIASQSDPVDLLVVVDRSNSMGDNMAGTSTPDDSSEARDGILVNFLNDYIEDFLAANSANQVAVAWFASKTGTIQDWSHTQTWLTVDNAGAMYRETNSQKWDGGGGTNYQAGIYQARQLLEEHASNNDIKNHKVIVLFLSDGEPTLHYTTTDASDYVHSHFDSYAGYDSDLTTGTYEQFFNGTTLYPNGGGNTTSTADAAATNNATSELLALINDGSLGTVDMRAIAYSTDATDTTALQYLNALSPGNGNTAILAESASDLTNNISKLFNPTAVTITDTLSEYVDFAEQLDIKVTKRANTTGEETVLYTQSKADETGTNNNSNVFTSVTIDTDTKTITAKFADSFTLENSDTYTLSFNVMANKTAEDYLKNHNGAYPAVSDSDTSQTKGDSGTDYGTNTTSSGQAGFYANKTATVSYTLNSTKKTETYSKPVVQSDSVKALQQFRISSRYITVEKTFTGIYSLDDLPGDFALTVGGKTLATGDSTDQTVAVDPETLTFSQTYRWTVETSDTAFGVSEENAGVDDYNLSAEVNGEALSADSSVTIDGSDVGATIAGGDKETDCSTHIWNIGEDGDNLRILALTIPGNTSAVVVSTEDLTARVRASVESALQAKFGSGVWKNITYYVCEDSGSITYKSRLLGYDKSTGNLVIPFTSQWENVARVTIPLDKVNEADITVTNSYTLATGKIQLQKTDPDGKAITGAGFQLWVKNANGVDTLVTNDLTVGKSTLTVKDGKMDGKGDETVFYVDNSGALTIEGLPVGSYYLKETVSPKGYYMIGGEFNFSVSKSGISPTGETPSGWSYNSSTGIITAINHPGAELPNTGGMGTLPLALAGLGLMTASLVLGFAIQRKRKREEVG